MDDEQKKILAELKVKIPAQKTFKFTPNKPK